MFPNLCLIPISRFAAPFYPPGREDGENYGESEENSQQPRLFEVKIGEERPIRDPEHPDLDFNVVVDDPVYVQLEGEVEGDELGRFGRIRQDTRYDRDFYEDRERILPHFQPIDGKAKLIAIF